MVMCRNRRGRKMTRRSVRVRRKRRTTYRKQIASSNRHAVTRITKAPTSPLGKYFKMVLPYVEQVITLNPGIGGIPVFHHFSANGLYDPNVTGGGHQPLGFDQVMPMYDHYTVIGSKITITAFNNDTVNKQIVGIRLADATSSTSTDMANLMENGGGKYVWLNTKGADGDSVTLTLGCSPKKFFQKSLNDDTYKGNVSSNPFDQVLFQIWGAPLTAVDSAEIYCNVRIDYIALFTEPKILGSS